MPASDSTARDAWASVARAASAGAAADGVLGATIRQALNAGVAEDDLVDALLSGDPSLELSDAVERVESERARAALISSTYERIVRNWAVGG